MATDEGSILIGLALGLLAGVFIGIVVGERLITPAVQLATSVSEIKDVEKLLQY